VGVGWGGGGKWGCNRCRCCCGRRRPAVLSPASLGGPTPTPPPSRAPALTPLRRAAPPRPRQGHCGYSLPLDTTVGAAFTALNPFLVVNKLTAAAMTPEDHAQHHLIPTKNFALFFTWWCAGAGAEGGAPGAATERSGRGCGQP
jgi:hypothetical protein